MKTIGVIGGLSWHSTLTYYGDINRHISRMLGGHSCAELVLVQTDFELISRHIDHKRWDDVATILTSLAQKLERAGADFVVIACNTVHKVVALIEAGIGIPILHIVDTVSAKLLELDIRRVALIGGHTTMTDGFFAARLSKAQIETLLPDQKDQEALQHALISELASGIFLPETRAIFRGIIDKLISQGAGAIVLGCTEFGQLLEGEKCSVPLIDTARVHSEAAAKMACE